MRTCAGDEVRVVPAICSGVRQKLAPVIIKKIIDPRVRARHRIQRILLRDPLEAPMPKLLTDEQYQLLVDSYAEKVSHRAAGKAAGVSPHTAKNYYLNGVNGRLPIAAVIRQEQENMRAHRARNQDRIQDATAQRDALRAEAEADAAKDAKRTIQQEGQLLLNTRVQLGYMDDRLLQPLLKGSAEVAAMVGDYLQRAADENDHSAVIHIGNGPGETTVNELMDLFRLTMGVVRMHAAAKAEVIKAERVRMGDPADWIAEDDDLGDLPREKAAIAAELREANAELTQLLALVEAGAVVVEDD